MKAILLMILSVLHVQLVGGQVEGIPIRLELYRYVTHPDYVEVQIWYSQTCLTDAEGRCTFEIGETEGGLRGRLTIGEYGQRDVIWPGGDLSLMLNTAEVSESESKPYDFQEPAERLVVRRAGRGWLTVLLVILILAVSFLMLFLYRSEEERR